MIRHLLMAAGLSVLLTSVAHSQQDISFASKDLQNVALQYTGSTINWPVVVNLAKHDAINNRFSISGTDVLRLQNLAPVTLEFEKQQDRLSRLISTGAVLFAKNELIIANSLIEKFLNSVKSGDIELMTEIGQQIGTAIDNIETTLTKNRLVNIQAQLTKKEGKVDKRNGLLADWAEAFLNDLFEESDGIKTYVKSFATLTFTDGSRVQVNPQTEAVIRKSRIDKLSESSDTEITLIEGGLLAKLSGTGQEKGNYILNAGASTTLLKTKNFYAENSDDDNVKLTNYDGTARVSANDVTINIGKNEGTIIQGNSAPLPPIKLVDAPKFLSESKDTVIFDDSFLLSFLKVDDAESYYIQTSTSFGFDDNLQNYTTSKQSLNVENLSMGVTYIRIQSVDKLGLKGPFSEVYRVIRNADTQPPPIFGDHFKFAIIFSNSGHFTLQGVTEPDAIVKIENAPVEVSKSGAFNAVLNLEKADQTFAVTATDNSNNTETKQVRLVKLMPEALFALTVNGRKTSGNGNDTINGCDECTVTGTAYPDMEVTLTNNEFTKKIKTDSRGKWGIKTALNKGILSVSFKAINFTDVYLNQELIIQ